MLAGELLSYIKVKKICGDIENIDIEYISEDSRAIKNGAAFICIEGSQADGHLFVENAKNNGAKIFIASKNIADKAGDVPVVYVKDTLKVMGLLSNVLYGEPSKKLFMVGITGTNGKTTTSYLINHIFETVNLKTGLIGTIHHKIGKKIIPTKNTTPISATLQGLLKQMAVEKCDTCIMEVSSHALALDRVLGCDFDCAVFTNLSHEHLDLHKTMENYAHTKELLFTQLGHNLKNAKLKTAILNIDDKYSKEYKAHTPAEVITYGINDKTADFYADEILFDDWKMKFDLHFLGDVYKVETNLVGLFNVYNVLAAICTAFAKGIAISEAIESLKSFSGVSGRMETVNTDKSYKIIIDFAHTPDGLMNVLETLSKISHNRIITLIGHSGGNRDSSMRPALGKIALENSDEVVFTADNPRNESVEHIVEGLIADCAKTNYTVIEDRKKAIEYAFSIAGENDIVLLAGKGAEPYQVIGSEYLPYSEIETVKEILGKI
nr:UDP-N-acetylmuramoyl-L-alanyl-D-glutamate--2,6-diaminopimelate ligase [uncultured Catonella sp.]